MNFQQFQQTKQELSREEFLNKYDQDEHIYTAPEILLYGKELPIEKNGDTYSMTIERGIYKSQNLEELERRLFDFATQENML